MDTVSNSNGARVGFPANRIVLAGIAALFVLGALVYFVFDPTRISIFPSCMFHSMTGLDCPGCGGQRALHELLHGNVIAALHMNAMFVLSLPLAAWYGPRLITRSFQRRPSGTPPRWIWFYIAAWIAFGIARNLPFPICRWFAA